MNDAKEARMILFLRTYIFIPTLWLFYFVYDGIASSEGLAIAVLVAAFLATLVALYMAAYRTVMPTLILFIISVVSYFLNMELVMHGALSLTIFGGTWWLWRADGSYFWGKR